MVHRAERRRGGPRRERAGAVVDLLIELVGLVGLACLAAGVVSLLHGTWRLGPFVLAALAVLALEVSRTLRTEYTFGVRGHHVPAHVDTTSAPFVGTDAAVLTAGLVWLVHSPVDLGGPVTVLVAAAGLLGARIWARHNPGAPDAGFAADLAGAVLDFVLDAAALVLIADGTRDLSRSVVLAVAGVALLAVLARRIVRGRYVLHETRTVSLPHFGSDVLLLAAAASLGDVISAAAVAGLFGLRIWARLHRLPGRAPRVRT